MNINDILLLAQKKGMRSGEIKLIIIKGVIKNAEYLIREWEDEYRPRSMDGIVDNKK